MRNLRGLVGATLLTCSLLALTHTAHAARRSGLAGSLLIEDKDDMFFFPQLLPQYRNLLGLDYGATSGAGNAVLTLGDADLAWGVALHRGDVMTPHAVNELAALNGPGTLFGGAPFTATAAPATIVDFLLGSSVGPDSSWGLRLALGRGADFTGNDADNGESEMFAMAEVGYGWGTRGQDTRIDLSGALLLDFASFEDQTAMTDASGTNIGFSALMRGFSPIDGTLDLGFLGTLAVNSNSVTFDEVPMEPSDSTLAFSLGGGVGPAFRFGPATLAAYGVLRARFESRDPNSEAEDDGQTEHRVIVPGVHMAVEVPVTDWLYVRSGAEYSFNVAGSSDEGGMAGDADDSATAQNFGEFSWNAGLGLVIDSFRFDGSLQHGFVTGGPDFIGGSSPGFLAIASLIYSFDELRSGGAVAPEPEPESVEPPPPPSLPEPSLSPAPPPPSPETSTEVDNPEAGVGVTIGGSAGVQTAPAPAPAQTAPSR